ncbi:DUF1330 domain-containing protein [Aureimonas mangrovi]|uniref:DUF1330 domain-containing protein n=1 Tax=Aureimonas mangrovi TaxID=2758041 RepID=UPI00163DAE3A|nr:DUF1330 domain-containing protein [Aureimonas mangrovi]
MAKAYWIARVDVHDPERYKDYVATAAPAFEEFGAKFIVRGGPFREMEGVARTRNVVIEFETMEKALACHQSPQYQAAKQIREEVAEGDIVIVEGV